MDHTPPSDPPSSAPLAPQTGRDSETDGSVKVGVRARGWGQGIGAALCKVTHVRVTLAARRPWPLLLDCSPALGSELGLGLGLY